MGLSIDQKWNYPERANSNIEPQQMGVCPTSLHRQRIPCNIHFGMQNMKIGLTSWVWSGWNQFDIQLMHQPFHVSWNANSPWQKMPWNWNWVFCSVCCLYPLSSPCLSYLKLTLGLREKNDRRMKGEGGWSLAFILRASQDHTFIIQNDRCLILRPKN